MTSSTSRRCNWIGRSLGLAATLAGLAGCGQADDDASNIDRVVGTWTSSGRVPVNVALTLTFRENNTFLFEEQVSPRSLPAGFVPTACITTDSYEGTYTGNAGGSNLLTWKFASGTANRISQCDDPSMDSPGSPMTTDAVHSYIDQGYMPPTTVNFVATPTTLVLSSPDDDSVGIARSRGTTFVKSQ